MAKKKPEEDDDIINSYEEDEEENYDDDSDSSNSEEAQKELAFKKEVKKNITIISKPKQFKKNQRVDAARWLGEVGDPEAIPALVKVYQKDKTPGMKEAAQEALSMFQAVHEMYDDPETENDVYLLWSSIILDGKMGKRINMGGVRLKQLVLLISLIFLSILAVSANAIKQSDVYKGIVPATRTPAPPTATPSPTPDTPEVVAEQLRDYYVAVLNDANALQGQMNTITRGESQDCTLQFANPSDFILSPAGQSQANLVELTSKTNEAANMLDPVREAFLASCAANVPPDRQAALDFGTSVIEAQRILRDAAVLFGDANIELPPTATPSPTPTATPQPTLDVRIADPHMGTLEIIIEQMNGQPRGITVLALSYWQNIQEFGSSEGCLQPEPIYPEDYILPADIAAQFPSLRVATDSVNLGLQLTRQASGAFFAGCPTRSFPDLERHLQDLTLAQAAFAEAQTFIDQLRGG